MFALQLLRAFFNIDKGFNGENFFLKCVLLSFYLLNPI